ncbi:macrolide-specific efflux system membrane fusion protein [Paenibacillus castaneae]|uniref:efflux RND transporter periplasmic adaptor subunit n=1 Tax=Paenibacillus castaneae TaxID=474957 RepID=UPI000C9A38EC|nr:efflux RND transporter periplasmic adaptor subunit [Paenibacillus castaneae]NIK80226.1 macrolide-specific efflux system membrane fusion protein [Paenibacillus castaneae]
MSHKFKKMLGWSFALLISASLTGCSLLPAEENALKPPLVKPAQESYRTVVVEKGTISQEINGNGSLESIDYEIAQFKGQGGRIAKMLVSAGNQVKKGDVLVQLGVDGLDIQLKEQQLSVEKAKLAVKQAKLNDDSDTLKIAQLQMDVESLKLERLMTTFNSKQLVAEMDGQVTFVEDLEPGDFVDAYQTLVIISDPSKLRIALRVDTGSEISGVNVGFPAKVTFGTKVVQGKVVQTPSSAPTTLNPMLQERYSKTLYIELAELPSDAAIGGFADVKIILQQRDDVLKIPRSGVRSFLGRTFVRTLEEGNKIREIDVETGIKGSTEIEITKGLEEGAVVVLQ